MKGIAKALKPYGYRWLISATGINGPGALIVVDDKIGEYLNLVTPETSTVVAFLWEWGVPAIVTAVALHCYHLSQKHWGYAVQTKSVRSLTMPTPLPSTAISQRSAQIIVGTGRPYETVEPSGVNRSRIVRVKVENHTDTEILNGTLKIVNLDPPQKGHEDFFLKGDLIIGPGKHIFVDIAAYNEGASQAKPGTWIRLLIPLPPGNGLLGNLPVIPHTFHLRLSSLDVPCLAEIYCRLFVDQNHILHLEDWGDSTKVPLIGLTEKPFPKISAIYDPLKSPPCRDVSLFGDGRNGMVYRIEVENFSHEDIVDCEGYLTEVAFDDEPAELGTMYLTWCAEPTPTTKIVLKKAVKRHLDLLVVYEDNQIRIISPTWPPFNRQNFFVRRGNYRFSIVIGGRDTTLPPYKIRLTVTGDWQDSTAEPF